MVTVVTCCLYSCRDGEVKINSTHWDFDGISSETIVRPSKSRSTDDTPVTPTTPTSGYHDDPSWRDHHQASNGTHPLGARSSSSEGVAKEEGAGLGGIDDTVFVENDESSGHQRSSVTSSEGRGKRGSTISVEGSSGLVVVSGCANGCGLRDIGSVLQSYQEGEVKLPDLDTISLGGVVSQSKSLTKIIIPLLKQVSLCIRRNFTNY